MNLKVSLGTECYLLPQPGYTTVMLQHCRYHTYTACLNSFPLPFAFIIFPVCWDSGDQIIHSLMLLTDLSENAVWCMLRATWLHVFLTSWVYIKKKIFRCLIKRNRTFCELLRCIVLTKKNGVLGVSYSMDKSYVLCRSLIFALILSRIKHRQFQNWKGNSEVREGGSFVWSSQKCFVSRNVYLQMHNTEHAEAKPYFRMFYAS